MYAMEIEALAVLGKSPVESAAGCYRAVTRHEL